MINPVLKPNRRWLWRAAAATLGLVIVLSLSWGIYSRLSNRKPSLETPAPADLTQDPTGDPNDLDKIPSFVEAKQYLEIVTSKKTLTDTEFERVILLAGYTKHTTTVLFASSAAAVAIKSMKDPESARLKFLNVVVANLKASNTQIRQSSIHSIGNLKANDRTELIIPFMKSVVPAERDAAKMTLTKLGYQFPPDPKPPGE